MVLGIGHYHMTVEDFRQWLTKVVDRNHDGRISISELRHALKGMGYNMAAWKGFWGVVSNDLNHNGYIDTEVEILALASYAARVWGITIV
ncbi:uncharacterized protein LOC120250184 [Dioscorea cayenensis subsp. rotundata]|uniref:Uncharacterized protein LOC120250184 n=1 Tax=Dioscorea cayennensis subsp. rotundata TaxID=55577 RepID=A0AB40AJ38_DIOCR|nr:uncharacterized protein LOC120250184 [Dioscorea cayenensis subsp. rotundata]